MNNSRPAKTFQLGEYVVIRNVDTQIGTNKKLIPTYSGPYRIHKVLIHDRYVVRNVENCPITRLPYDGLIEANRMRKWLLPYQIDLTLHSQDSGNTVPIFRPSDETASDELEEYDELTDESRRFPGENAASTAVTFVASTAGSGPEGRMVDYVAPVAEGGKTSGGPSCKPISDLLTILFRL